ncbi:hypothetical protein TPY_3135 [Sulfobacillus acidophilus TPY]|uniref:Uncharacterized protein n=1 Tax=Sulfobacillus acidophilus (strain ATCC 700253 / DSM 10332 / NAL) TaxID=679936 RepID=G8TZZ6_SULAD|nr:hypothetical protein TPY_3135 [Sulfobacillus acidophilus TPY]AEW04165.1 hypothetical protein Sulac_0652 [Sulfobacillus acidophilus DSM 10332]
MQDWMFRDEAGRQVMRQATARTLSGIGVWQWVQTQVGVWSGGAYHGLTLIPASNDPWQMTWTVEWVDAAGQHTGTVTIRRASM